VFLLNVGIKCRVRKIPFIAAAAAKLSSFVVVFAASAVFGFLVVTACYIAASALVSALVVFRIIFFAGVLLRLFSLLGVLLVVVQTTAHFDVIHLNK